MGRVHLILASLVVVLPAHAQSNGRGAQTPAAKVDQIAARWNRPGPGIGVMVLKGGQVLLEKGYGLADIDHRTPIMSETRFLLASVSKQFTAWAVMLLADRGKLSYDDPLSKFFPEFPRYADSITVRMILNHLAGFSEYEQLFVEKGLVDENWPRSSTSPPSRFEPTAHDALALVAKETTLRFSPGTRFEYSNTGYMVLAQIVEKVTEQRFAAFLASEIFTPLGMTRTLLYDETKPIVANRAVSYRTIGTQFREIDYTPFNSIYGEDNVITTLGDLAKWARSLDRASLASAAAQQMAWTPGRLRDGSATQYGFGWSFATALGRRLVLHGGAWIGFRTAIVRFPEDTLTVAVLANQEETEAEILAIQIGAAFLGGQVELPVERAVSRAALRAVAGRYRVRPGIDLTVAIRGRQAVLTAPRWGQLRLAFVSDTVAYVAGEGIRKFTFRRAKNGRVGELLVDQLGTTWSAARVAPGHGVSQP